MRSGTKQTLVPALISTFEQSSVADITLVGEADERASVVRAADAEAVACVP
jgi:hypothetical protein